MRLLLTRPEAEAKRTAAALRARGHAVVILPLMHIELVADAEIGCGTWAAIVTTSARAAPAVAAHRDFNEVRGLSVFAVGERSARAMRAAGFIDVASADGDKDDLVRLVAERLQPGSQLLYLAGENRSGDLAAALGARNFVVRTVVIYRAVAAPTVPPAALREVIKGGIDGVLHFSRRSAQTYANVACSAGLLEDALRKPTHFCLSRQVAEPLLQAHAPDICIRIAPRPTEAALIQLIPAT